MFVRFCFFGEILMYFCMCFGVLMEIWGFGVKKGKKNGGGGSGWWGW